MNRIHINSIKFHLNIKFWTLETFLYIPLALLVKFPTVSLYFFFHLVSSSRTDPVSRPIFPIRWPSHTVALPQFFYIIHFKPNLFFKEDNSKIFSETPSYKIVLTLYLIIFH
jgi:hypothetical protein